MQHVVAEKINTELRQHQISLDAEWQFGKAAADLHIWAERMIVEFKLDIGTPAIAIDVTSVFTLGTFRYGRNGLGLKDETTVSRCHLTGDPYWTVLATLLHEALHSWQQYHGSPPSPNSWNYHNREFRDKAIELGLVVDSRGCQRIAVGPTPFHTLLSKHGVTVPDTPFGPVRPAGRSRLALYECGCGVKVRVGRARFNAQCLDCGTRFVLKTAPVRATRKSQARDHLSAAAHTTGSP